MTRATVFLLAALFGAIEAAAQTAATLVAPLPIFDFGVKPQGASFSGAFVIENPGDSLISISEIAVHCSCAKAELKEKSIPPKGKATLNFTFETRAFEGQIAKALEIRWHGGPRPGLLLTIKGTVQARWSVEPTSLEIGEVRPGDRIARTILVRVDPERPLEVTAAKAAPGTGALLVPLPADAKTPGLRRFELTLAVPPDAKPGPLHFAVSLEAQKDENKPAVLIPIVGHVRGDLSVTPRTVSFGRIEKGGEQRRTVRFESAAGAPFRILATATDGVLEVVGRSDAPGPLHELTIVCPARAPSGPLRSLVTITTDHPEEARIVLTVLALVGDS